MVDYNKYRRGEILSGINITPFTDIILVLLITFMVAAPGLFNTALNVSLPGSSTSQAKNSQSIAIAIDQAGVYYVDGVAIDEQSLKTKMEALSGEDQAVVVNADQSAKHGRVIALYDLLREVGIQKIYVGTVKR